VETVSRAVTLIGTKELGILALGITVMTCFRGIPGDLIDMKLFWRHSVACGIAARIMADQKKIPNTERVFTAALLHDIGRLVAYKYMADEAAEALLQARFQNATLLRTEAELLGFDHASFGADLLNEWRLPVSIENCVRRHHDPMSSSDPLEPAIINLADIMAVALRIGSGGENFVLQLDPEAWNLLDFSKNIFAALIKQIDRQVEELTRIFVDEQ
jgi:putative nucleotidyltransferase with HDIG domain